MGARVVSVTSGKGGVGKSHLAANLASVWARDGLRVLVLDADASLANVDLLLGAPTRSRHLGHLLDGADPWEVIAPIGERLWLLPGAPGERRLASIEDAGRARLLEIYAELSERFDVVVVDVGSGLGDDVLFFSALGASTVLVVTDEPTSLSDAAALVTGLERRAAASSVEVVVNGVRSVTGAQSVFGRLSDLVPMTSLRLRLATHVPEDQNLRRAAMVGKPLVSLAPTSPASRAFERLAKTLWSASPKPCGAPWETLVPLAEDRLEP